MTETDLLYLEQLREQRNIKLQLIPHALKLGNSYNVKDLIKAVDTLYRYIARVETDEPKKCNTDEVYKQFGIACGIKSNSNPEYDRGSVDSSSEKIPTIATIFPQKSQDIYLPKKYLPIELDCEDIKFEKCSDACDCVDLCKDATEEAIKPWNTDEFKKECEDFIRSLLTLDNELNVIYGNIGKNGSYLPDYSKIEKSIKKYSPLVETEDGRKKTYDMLHHGPWNTNSTNPYAYGVPPTPVHTKTNQEREELYKLCIEAKAKKESLQQIYSENISNVYDKNYNIVKPKKSYFEEWDKERTLRLSQPQERNDQQLLLSI